MTALLEIENLQTQFFTSAGTVRAVDGMFAAFIAWIGARIGFAALARGAAGKAKAFGPVVSLLQFFDGETVAGGFGSHVEALPYRDQKMWTSSKPVWNTMISPFSAMSRASACQSI